MLLLDRVDIHIEVPRVPYEKLTSMEPGEPTESIRQRVEAARIRQRERLASYNMACNADMGPAQIRELCPLNTEGQTLMRTAMRQMQLSARAYHRVLKVSRTIADLADTANIQPHHLAEALQYRARVLDL